MDPLISIIMPNYNGERYIERSIRSFLNSGYPNKELIIIDGKSTDKSHSIIESHVECSPFIKLYKEKDLGISDAINMGLEIASGDIIGYLGSDDLLNAGTLEQVARYKSLIDFDAIYFDSYTYYIERKTTLLRKCPNIEFNKKNLVQFGTIVGLQNIFFDKRVYAECRYNVQNKYSMDYEIYFQIVEKFTNFLYIEYPATINIFHNNISHNLSREQQKEALSVIFKRLVVSEYRFIPLKKVIRHLLGR